MTNPLSVEHLLLVQKLVRELRGERYDLFGGLPFGTRWLRLRYLREGTIRTLANVAFTDSPTMSLHRIAFGWSDELLLKGLIQHELIHIVLGASEGHSRLFRQTEQKWEHYTEWKRMRQKFARALETDARQRGRLHKYECPNCGLVLFRTRRLRAESACSKCCKILNDGVWSESYTLIRVGSSDTNTEEKGYSDG